MAGKAEDYGTIRENNEQLLNLYTKAIAEGKEMLKESGFAEEEEEEQQVELKPISKEEVSQLCDAIRQACENFDSDEAASSAEKMIGCICGDIDISDYAKKIKNLADDFECDEAVEELDKLMKKLGMES